MYNQPIPSRSQSFAYLLVVLIFASAFTIVFHYLWVSSQIREIERSLASTTLLPDSIRPALTQSATLGLNPSSGNVSVGGTLSVAIVLDTGGNNTSGVDIRYLRYDPSLLQVQDANSALSGVQIQAGTLFPNTPSNSVNTTNGTIQFSQTVAGGGVFNGSGTLATVTFKALAAGSVAVTFDFTLGSTTDTNVSGADPLTSTGVDVLSSVTNGTYTISGIADNVAPSVSITSPAPDTTVIGTVNVTATASDNVGVTKVEFLVDGTVKTTDTASPYLFVWDTTNGGTHPCIGPHTHALTAKAYDAAGNVTTSSAVTVNMNDPVYCAPAPPPPPPENTLPIGALDGAIADDIWGWAYDADAGSNPIEVHIYVNNVPTINLTANLARLDLVSGGVIPDPNHGFSWKNHGLGPGTYTIEAFAINFPMGTNPSIGKKTLTISAAPLSVSITAPLNNATVSGTVVLSATTSGNVGVSGVQFTLNGVALGPEVAIAPYSFSWDTTRVANRSYTLSAVARDTLGNRVKAPEVSVLVNNTYPLYNMSFVPQVEGRSVEIEDNVSIGIFDTQNNVRIVEFTLKPDETGILHPAPADLTLVAPGTYDILIDMSGYLKRKLAGATLGPDTSITLPRVPVGDLNNDGLINSIDWSLMNPDWRTGNKQSDFNRDGIVNTLDWSFMNKNWNLSDDA